MCDNMAKSEDTVLGELSQTQPILHDLIYIYMLSMKTLTKKKNTK